MWSTFCDPLGNLWFPLEIHRRYRVCARVTRICPFTWLKRDVTRRRQDGGLTGRDLVTAVTLGENAQVLMQVI